MNQVEQWFSVLQRKRLRVPNFDDLTDLEDKILAFISEWNAEAKPFNWTRKSFDKAIRRDRRRAQSRVTSRLTTNFRGAVLSELHGRLLLKDGRVLPLHVLFSHCERMVVDLPPCPAHVATK
jgi:hypothetical protein